MKNILKRALATFLVVAIVLCSAPLSGLVGLELPDWADFSIESSAATSGTCGDNLTWSYNDTNYVLTISGTGAMNDYSSYNRPWESYEDSIKTVVIEDGVTTVGKYAFYDFGSLTSVTIPDGVTSIGNYAFYVCTSLASISVDSDNQYYSSDEYGVLLNKDKTTLIQYPAGNTRTTYTIPDGVTSIGEGAFGYCASLTSITIPDSVTSIGDSAFRECRSLTSVTIPNSVTTIGAYSFYKCKSLTNIEISNSITTIGNHSFGYCYELINVNIPDSVTSIGEGTFLSCQSLSNITIPNNIKTIGNEAFAWCTSFTNITIPDSVTSIGRKAFANCYNLTELTIGNGVTEILNEAFLCCNNLASVNIGAKVETIAYKAFYDCLSITSINLPDSVTYVGGSAFYNCTSLASVNIPEGINYLGSNAFYNCKSLTSVSLPNSITKIDDYTFYNCTNLESVSLGANVKTIGNSAFEHCENLSNIENIEKITTIGNNAFCCCYNLKNIPISNNVTSIGNASFLNCLCFTKIIIPENVISIGDSAFMYCESLTEISVDSSNQYYSSDEYGVLFNKDKTTLIQYPIGNTRTDYFIPNSVTSVNDYAFWGCTNLTSITIPDSVTSIGASVFWRCTNLTSVTIGDSVTSIGPSAFSDCTNLRDVYYNGTEEQWNQITVDNTGGGNDPLLNATIHFSSSGGDIPSDDDVTSDKAGTCGNNLSWSLDNKGVLTISGTGDMYNWPDSLSAPWVDYRNSISSIVIGDGVTSIGTYAFNYCMNCTSVSIPDTVTSIGNYAFDTCSSLTSITIPISVISVGDYAFYNCIKVTDVYYPGTDKQWNKIGVGVGNVFTTAKLHMDTCKLDELSSVDYLAFSQLSYSDDLDVSDEITIRESLKDIWNDEWANNITYGELYAEIASWTACKFKSNGKNGFAAYAFKNNYDEIVIAYRGSRSLVEKWNKDTYNDWVKNDLPMILGDYNTEQTQFYDAINFFNEAVGERSIDMVATTGHSLGGAWANVASAYSGCDCESFNAISALDVVYECFPEYMGKNYNGVNNYNFTDHINEYDEYAGDWGKELKKYIVHESLYEPDDGVLGFANHSMNSMVIKDKDGNLSLTEPLYKNNHTEPLSWTLGFGRSLYLCTKDYSHRYNAPNGKSPFTVYGSNGEDKITTGIKGDILVGGKGNDLLDGGYGDDEYYYFKGDGVDTVNDISGVNYLYLYDFDKNDSFTTISQGSYLIIKCNGSEIIKVRNNSSFFILAYSTSESCIFTKKLNPISSIYPSRVIIACPVNVEIINDVTNEVVYTLYDGTEGTYYTEYGYFYVYQDENGDYIKIADLYEGYSIRIIGTDTGTMDVSVSNLAGGEDGSTFSAAGVPVTSNLVATIEEIDNEKYLVIDSDGDGNIDNRVQLVEEKEYNYTFSIQTPSRTEIRHKDGIKLHAKVEGTAPAGSYVKWTANNGKFKTEEINNGNSLKIVSDSNGKTTFTATLYSADGKVLATDTIEMKSKAGFFDKIGSFFRSIFGTTKTYES